MAVLKKETALQFFFMEFYGISLFHPFLFSDRLRHDQPPKRKFNNQMIKESGCVVVVHFTAVASVSSLTCPDVAASGRIGLGRCWMSV